MQWLKSRQCGKGRQQGCHCATRGNSFFQPMIRRFLRFWHGALQMACAVFVRSDSLWITHGYQEVIHMFYLLRRRPLEGHPVGQCFLADRSTPWLQPVDLSAQGRLKIPDSGITDHPDYNCGCSKLTISTSGRRLLCTCIQDKNCHERGVCVRSKR